MGASGRDDRPRYTLRNLTLLACLTWLGAMAACEAPWRADDGLIAIADLTGLDIQDAAVANIVVSLATEQGWRGYRQSDKGKQRQHFTSRPSKNMVLMKLDPYAMIPRVEQSRSIQ